LGSIFAGLFSKVVPLLKGLFGSSVGRKVLGKAHKTALNAGLQLARDATSGKNVWKSAKRNMRNLRDDMVTTFNEDAKPALKRSMKTFKSKARAKGRNWFSKARGKARRWASKYSLDDLFD